MGKSVSRQWLKFTKIGKPVGNTGLPVSITGKSVPGEPFKKIRFTNGLLKTVSEN
jgi:hypothetical protein